MKPVLPAILVPDGAMFGLFLGHLCLVLHEPNVGKRPRKRKHMELDPDVADDVTWSESVTAYDDYLNGQAVSFRLDGTKPAASAAISPAAGDETDFAASSSGGFDGQAA